MVLSGLALGSVASASLIATRHATRRLSPVAQASRGRCGRGGGGEGARRLHARRRPPGCAGAPPRPRGRAASASGATAAAGGVRLRMPSARTVRQKQSDLPHTPAGRRALFWGGRRRRGGCRKPAPAGALVRMWRGPAGRPRRRHTGRWRDARVAGWGRNQGDDFCVDNHLEHAHS